MKEAVLVRVCIAVLKPDYKQPGEDNISAYTSTSQSIIQKQGGWEPGGRNQHRGHGGVLFTGLFSVVYLARFLIAPSTTNPEVVPPTVG